MTDDADWNAEIWEMEPQGLDEFAQAFEKLALCLRKDFFFASMWAGDQAETITDLSLDQLLELIRASQLGTTNGYRVKMGTDG